MSELAIFMPEAPLFGKGFDGTITADAVVAFGEFMSNDPVEPSRPSERLWRLLRRVGEPGSLLNERDLSQDVGEPAAKGSMKARCDVPYSTMINADRNAMLGR